MGFWAGVIVVAKVVTVSVGTVAAIGAITYGIYKIDQYWRDKSHKHGKGSPPPPGKGGPPPPAAGGTNYVTIEDIKPTTANPDTEVRCRKVTKEDVQNKIDQYWRDKSHKHGKGSPPPPGKAGPPPPAAGGTNYVTIEDIKPTTAKPDTEVRRRKVTKEDVQNKVNEDKSIRKEDASDEPQKKIEQCHKEVKTVSVQETQTEIFNLQGLPLPDNGNLLLNNDAISVSSLTTFDETNSTCDSLVSTETVTSNRDLDFVAAGIPTWSEMSDRDRELCLCSGCEKPVSTVAIPCEHPYLCDECAPILKKFYKRCPLCRKVISGFQNI